LIALKLSQWFPIVSQQTTKELVDCSQKYHEVRGQCAIR
jgi:hypothetical protein